MEPDPDFAEPATPTAVAEPAPPTPAAKSAAEPRNIHRIGAASVENLRLKPQEAGLDRPGISVIKAATPQDAADEIRSGLRRAKRMHKQATAIGSATVKAIQEAGFDVIPNPSDALPNHHRLIHPDGVVGFSDENLVRLVQAFVNTTGN